MHVITNFKNYNFCIILIISYIFCFSTGSQDDLSHRMGATNLLKVTQKCDHKMLKVEV